MVRRGLLLLVAMITTGCGSSISPAPSSASVIASAPAPASLASGGVPANATSPLASPSVSTPSASPWTVGEAVRAAADPALLASLAALPPPADGARYMFAGMRQRGDWALLMIADADPQAATEGGFALAVRENGQWKVTLATDTPAFCTALAKAPAGALTQDERDYFMGCT